MADQTKNIFISHVHEDDAGLGKIKDLLAKNGMTIRDSSINSSNPNHAKSPEYIKSNILAPQIKWAGMATRSLMPSMEPAGHGKTPMAELATRARSSAIRVDRW